MRVQSVATILAGTALALWLAFTGNDDAFDPLAIQDAAVVPAGALAGAETIGQSFVFHYPRLHSIQLRWVVSDDFACARDCRVTLHLRQRVDDATDVATASVSARDIHHNDFARFDFPPLQDSQDQAYYFFIDATQAAITRGSLSVWASDDDAYPDGQMYLGARPVARDLAFRAYSAPDLGARVAALQRALTRHLSALLFATLVFLVPGFLWLGGFEFSLIESVARASGITLALVAVAPIVFAALGAPLNGLALLAVIIALGLIVRRGEFNRRRSPRTEWLAALLALLSLAVGLLQIQDLPAPLWVDSPTHAAYINTLVAGQLPASVYHLGYHSVVAFLVQLAGISIPQAMLVVGQLLITLCGLAVFALSKKISGNTLGALASAICVWFLAPMPAYLITWGRYPLLLGATLLPIALVGAMELLDQPRLNARAIFFAMVTCLGVGFAQIRLIAFYAFFIAVYALATRGRARGRVAILAGATVAFAALWLATLFANHLGLDAILARNAGAVPIDLTVAFQVAFSHHGVIVGALAGIAAFVALWRRSRGALIVLVWFIALSAFALVAGEYVAPSLVVLLGFLPASLLIGDLVAWLDCQDQTARRDSGVEPLGGLSRDLHNPLKRRVQVAEPQKSLFFLSPFIRARSDPRSIFLALLALVSILGAREIISIVNPATILFTRADENAMGWLREHTPENARFLINSFQWYGDYIVPSDGGAWIPYWTHRAALPLDVSPATTSQDADALNAWIAQRGITHIYLGRRAGLLRRALFADLPARYELIYDQDGIAIFRVR